MHIHYLQHASFEGISCLKPWIQQQGHNLSGTRFYLNETLPEIDNVDWLIIMGGPMGVNDVNEYPWLKEEIIFIQQAIAQQKKVLGICLGAQLIAKALGAQVRKHSCREIGWHPVKALPGLQQTILKNVIPAELITFHWHGDTFDIPEKAIPFLSSAACLNQGFTYGNHVVALQCHFETTPVFIEHLLQHCVDDLDGSAFVQSVEELKRGEVFCEASNAVMHVILTAMEN